MSTKVFIDGSAGTTGLRINERLSLRDDIELVILDEAVRKDIAARKAALNEADIAFLCLPDAAAIEAVSLVENPDTVIIDASTAHRTADDWTYGFPELEGAFEAISNSKRIANPGCHASGFIALVEPLVQKGIIPTDALLSATSLTGYSGGGKNMIAQYENSEKDILESKELKGGRYYALNQSHKHLPEMTKVCGLKNSPVFSPIVVPHYAGMEVIVPLHLREFGVTCADIEKVYKEYYQNGLVHFVSRELSSGFISSTNGTGWDDMKITVCGNEERATLVACFDNLGKGASGAAIQNMNIVMGVDQTKGLVV